MTAGLGILRTRHAAAQHGIQQARARYRLGQLRREDRTSRRTHFSNSGKQQQMGLSEVIVRMDSPRQFLSAHLRHQLIDQNKAKRVATLTGMFQRSKSPGASALSLRDHSPVGQHLHQELPA